jgi:SAM-dependent methyltransferase
LRWGPQAAPKPPGIRAGVTPGGSREREVDDPTRIPFVAKRFSSGAGALLLVSAPFMRPPVDLPYFDVLLEGLRQERPHLVEAFSRHVHWGYWGEGDRADGSLGDFAVAAERLTRRVCQAGEVKDGQSILDVGCGLGGTVASLDEHLHGVSLTGLNIDPRQLERCRATVHARKGNTIDFREGDACAMPFPDASFDVVLAVECAFHFPSRARFFAEARRVLKPGGLLALSDFMPTRRGAPLLAAQDLLFGRYIRNVVGPTDVSLTLPRYKELAQSRGLRLLHEEDITEKTLPTYAVLRRVTPDTGVNERTAWWGVSGMEWLGRLRLWQYMILSFESPAPRG